MTGEDPLDYRKACVSLRPWLDLCRTAGVPYVPAFFSLPFPMSDVYHAVDGRPAPIYEAALAWVKKELAKHRKQGSADTRWMVRWECCAPSNLKAAMAYGVQGFGAPFTEIDADDPRVFDCTIPDENNSTRLCVRPYVPPRVIAGYPLEFRVYADPSGVTGVSSYYPQRPLPDTKEMRDLAFLASNYADRLWHAGRFPAGMTADFLAPLHPKERQPLVFLEGGPPHLANPMEPVNAHPCCFAPGDCHGVALVPQAGAVTH